MILRVVHITPSARDVPGTSDPVAVAQELSERLVEEEAVSVICRGPGGEGAAQAVVCVDIAVVAALLF